MKFVLSTMNTGFDEPPSIHIETFEPENKGIESEGQLVQYIFREHGSGNYIIHGNPGSTYKTLWEAEIQIEDDRNLFFQARQNNLQRWTVVGTKQPLIDYPKRVSIPEGLREMVRRQLRTQS